MNRQSERTRSETGGSAAATGVVDLASGGKSVARQPSATNATPNKRVASLSTTTAQQHQKHSGSSSLTQNLADAQLLVPDGGGGSAKNKSKLQVQRSSAMASGATANNTTSSRFLQGGISRSAAIGEEPDEMNTTPTKPMRSAQFSITGSPPLLNESSQRRSPTKKRDVSESKMKLIMDQLQALTATEEAIQQRVVAEEEAANRQTLIRAGNNNDEPLEPTPVVTTTTSRVAMNDEKVQLPSNENKKRQKPKNLTQNKCNNVDDGTCTLNDWQAMAELQKQQQTAALNNSTEKVSVDKGNSTTRSMQKRNFQPQGRNHLTRYARIMQHRRRQVRTLCQRLTRRAEELIMNTAEISFNITNHKRTKVEHERMKEHCLDAGYTKAYWDYLQTNKARGERVLLTMPASLALADKSPAGQRAVPDAWLRNVSGGRGRNGGKSILRIRNLLGHTGLSAFVGREKAYGSINFYDNPDFLTDAQKKRHALTLMEKEYKRLNGANETTKTQPQFGWLEIVGRNINAVPHNTDGEGSMFAYDADAAGEPDENDEKNIFAKGGTFSGGKKELALENRRLKLRPIKHSNSLFIDYNTELERPVGDQKTEPNSQEEEDPVGDQNVPLVCTQKFIPNTHVYETTEYCQWRREWQRQKRQHAALLESNRRGTRLQIGAAVYSDRNVPNNVKSRQKPNMTHVDYCHDDGSTLNLRVTICSNLNSSTPASRTFQIRNTGSTSVTLQWHALDDGQTHRRTRWFVPYVRRQRLYDFGSDDKYPRPAWKQLEKNRRKLPNVDSGNIHSADAAEILGSKHRPFDVSANFFYLNMQPVIIEPGERHSYTVYFDASKQRAAGIFLQRFTLSSTPPYESPKRIILTCGGISIGSDTLRCLRRALCTRLRTRLQYRRWRAQKRRYRWNKYFPLAPQAQQVDQPRRIDTVFNAENDKNCHRGLYSRGIAQEMMAMWYYKEKQALTPGDVPPPANGGSTVNPSTLKTTLDYLRVIEKMSTSKEYAELNHNPKILLVKPQQTSVAATAAPSPPPASAKSTNTSRTASPMPQVLIAHPAQTVLEEANRNGTATITEAEDDELRQKELNLLQNLPPWSLNVHTLREAVRLSSTLATREKGVLLKRLSLLMNHIHEPLLVVSTRMPFDDQYWQVVQRISEFLFERGRDIMTPNYRRFKELMESEEGAALLAGVRKTGDFATKTVDNAYLNLAKQNEQTTEPDGDSKKLQEDSGNFNFTSITPELNEFINNRGGEHTIANSRATRAMFDLIESLRPTETEEQKQQRLTQLYLQQQQQLLAQQMAEQQQQQASSGSSRNKSSRNQQQQQQTTQPKISQAALMAAAATAAVAAAAAEAAAQEAARVDPAIARWKNYKRYVEERAAFYRNGSTIRATTNVNTSSAKSAEDRCRKRTSLFSTLPRDQKHNQTSSVENPHQLSQTISDDKKSNANRKCRLLEMDWRLMNHSARKRFCGIMHVLVRAELRRQLLQMFKSVATDKCLRRGTKSDPKQFEDRTSKISAENDMNGLHTTCFVDCQKKTNKVEKSDSTVAARHPAYGIPAHMLHETIYFHPFLSFCSQLDAVKSKQNATEALRGITGETIK